MRTLIIPLISFLATASPPQEVLSPEELLAWFPVGAYSCVAHWDREALQAAESYPLYKTHFEDPTKVEYEYGGKSRTLENDKGKHIAQGYLPPSLGGKYVSSTFAALTRDRVIVHPDGEEYDIFEKQNVRNGAMMYQLEVDGEQITVLDVGDSLYVYRYDNLDLLINQALEKGEIAATGEGDFERPIYKFVEKDYADREWGHYANATATQELLVADRIENLRRMIAAGHGVELDLLSETENFPLLKYIPDLGQQWTVFFSKARFELIVKLLRNKGADEETLTPWEEQAENGIWFRILSCELGENIVDRAIYVCGGREYAEHLMRIHKMILAHFHSNTTEGMEYKALLDEATDFTIEGTTLIKTTTYNAEILDARRKSDSAQLKQAIERQLQKQQK